MKDIAYQKCIIPSCAQTYDLGEQVTRCKCGNLIDVEYRWDGINLPKDLFFFDARRGDYSNIFNESGVWRFKELLPFVDISNVDVYSKQIVSLDGQEGKTKPLRATLVAQYCDIDPKHFYLQFEGMNPTGSFKDNGMTAGFTHANIIGAKRAIGASTGNTSASLAAYAWNSVVLDAFIITGLGKIAYGTLSHSLHFDARTIQR